MYSQYTILLCCTNPFALYQHWTKINKPSSAFSFSKWPIKRGGHAAACVSGPLLVIVGGMRRDDKWTTVSDCLIHDFTTMNWKKVICVAHVFQILYVWFWFSATTP